MTDERIFFIASKKKCDFLRSLEAASRPDNVPKVALLQRDKGDPADKHFADVFRTIKKNKKVCYEIARCL